MTETEQREISATVAEKVMGWLPDGRPAVWVPPNSSPRLFEPFTSANDDYEVLARVRETWPSDRKEKLWSSLSHILAERWCPGFRFYDQASIGWIEYYEPGDYCVAAYRVIAEGD